MFAQRVVLITGASSGVGQSTARLLSQRGYKVFGTSRNPAIAEIIPAVEMLPLDVRADDSVRGCVEVVSGRVGHIDVLINNAGYELAGALEELTSEEASAQFETNFFGVVRMVNAVLPGMRRQKRGHIINVSSLAGVSSIPFLGIYSASKFALEGYTEALRHELKPFNIQVSLTEAGFLKTPMTNHRQIAANYREFGATREMDSCRHRSGARERSALRAAKVLIDDSDFKVGLQSARRSREEHQANSSSSPNVSRNLDSLFQLRICEAPVNSTGNGRRSTIEKGCTRSNADETACTI